MAALLPALEEAPVEIGPASTRHVKVRGDYAFFEAGEPDRHLERGTW
jgi:hypothetical protein